MLNVHRFNVKAVPRSLDLNSQRAEGNSQKAVDKKKKINSHDRTHTYIRTRMCGVAFGKSMRTKSKDDGDNSDESSQ